MTDDMRVNLVPKSVAELSTALADARDKLTAATEMARRYDSEVRVAAAEEKAAYKAFNEAVAAMRPRRKARAAKGAEPATAAAEGKI